MSNKGEFTQCGVTGGHAMHTHAEGICAGVWVTGTSSQSISTEQNGAVMTKSYPFDHIITKLRTTRGSQFALDVMSEAADALEAQKAELEDWRETSRANSRMAKGLADELRKRPGFVEPARAPGGGSSMNLAEVVMREFTRLEAERDDLQRVCEAWQFTAEKLIGRAEAERDMWRDRWRRLRRQRTILTEEIIEEVAIMAAGAPTLDERRSKEVWGLMSHSTREGWRVIAYAMLERVEKML